MFPFKKLELGNIEYSSKKRILFQCKKNGHTFLGQAKICLTQKGIIVELFSENFWEQVPNKENTLKILKENLLKLLQQSDQITSEEYKKISSLWSRQNHTNTKLKKKKLLQIPENRFKKPLELPK